MIIKNKKYHVIGFKYEPNNPQLRVRDIELNQNISFIEIKDNLSIKIKRPRMCVGYKFPNKNNYEECNNKIELECSKVRCLECENKYGFVDSFYVKNSIKSNEEWKTYAQEETFCVYLAIYVDGLIKVGMTRYSRIKERLLEQGASIGCILLIGDGNKSRKIEKEVSSLGYTEKITLNQKLKILNSSNINKMIQQLTFAREYIKQKLYIKNNYYIDNEEFYICINDMYTDNEILNKTVHYIEVNQYSRIMGKVKLVKGSLIVLEYNQTLYCIDARKIISWCVEYDDGLNFKLPIQEQLTLF